MRRPLIIAGAVQKVMEFLGFFEKKALRSREMAIECSEMVA